MFALLPKDAVRVGILDVWGWRVNGPYNFEKINRLPVKKIITDDTEGFFKCYAETYSTIRAGHKELFGEQT